MILRKNVCTFSQAAVRGKGLDLKQKHILRNADSKFHDLVDFKYLWQPKRPGFTAHIAFHLIYSLHRDSVHTAEFGLKNDPICLSIYTQLSGLPTHITHLHCQDLDFIIFPSSSCQRDVLFTSRHKYDCLDYQSIYLTHAWTFRLVYSLRCDSVHTSKILICIIITSSTHTQSTGLSTHNLSH